MSPVLRPYQAALVQDLYAKISEGKNRVAIIAGTGAGKTVISGQICADAVAQGCRLMFLVHLDVLVGQTARKLAEFGLRCGFIKAGWEEDREAPIQIASVQTMAQRKWWRTWPADVVFYDEAHLTLFSQIGQEVLTRTHRPSIHLAMTATPERLGKAQLGDYLEDFVAAPPPPQLQAMGFLARMEYFSLPPASQVNLEGVRTVRGDYDSKGLKNACDRPELIDKIVQEWQRLTPGKRTIAFCVDVEHARNTALAFQKAGFPAAWVDGSTGRTERVELYRKLREGTLLILTSCNVISIGFDEPSVEVGLLLRPTQSSALHFQQVGRVMRISPDKSHGTILDQSGNLQRLGFPEDITSYTLPTRKKKRARRSAEMTKKVCPQCGRSQPGFLVQCGCGYSWAKDRTAITADLVQAYSSVQAHQIDDPAVLRAIFHGFRQRCFYGGYSLALAEEQFEQHTGRKPLEEWFRGSIFGDRPHPAAEHAYRDHLIRCARAEGRGQQWVNQQLRLEGFGQTLLR